VVHSMTGYGRHEQEFEKYSATVEIQSVNNRYLDINLRLPEILIPHETELRKTVNEFFERGQVTVKISLNGAGDKYSQLKVNTEMLRNYRRLLDEIKYELEIDSPPVLTELLTLPDLITYEQELPESSVVLKHVDEILRTALEDIQEMRVREGETLKKDLLERLNWLRETVDVIQQKSIENTDIVKQNLEERIQELLGDTRIDEDRLAQEAVYLVDKIDVTEEIVRLKSHIEQFEQLLQNKGGVGKKLNFLLQEMNREVNTIGAKSNNADISHLVVGCKNEIEKLREQVQNIE